VSITTSAQAELVPIAAVINGASVERTVEPRLLLAQLLRDELGLTGTHIGCNTSQCGACAVLVNGRPVKSCTLLAVQADGADVTTVEGLAGREIDALRDAFTEEHALQCGFCTPGFLVTASTLLRDLQQPTEQEVREELHGNLCRCTGYQNIIRAVLKAAETLK
jgi:aerobic-type carbon monoxide dehydrogenase small subunit (CoxS/CutS family)